MAWLFHILGCTETETPEPIRADPVVDEVFTLRVDPPSVDLRTGPAGAGDLQPDGVQFTATRIAADGSEQVLELVEWTLSNRSAGELTETGLFTPSTTNGAITYVTARLDDVEASAAVSLLYVDVLNEAGTNEALFDAPVSPTENRWFYPADGVNFPRNTPAIDFQWDATGAEASRLIFRSALTELTVYPPPGRWIADGDTWAGIASSNAGGEVDVTLELAAAGTVLQAPPLNLTVNRMDATGAILYFSTSASGLVRIPYGGVAESWLTAAQTGRCVGCHVVSSTGVVAFSYDGGNGPLALKDVTDGADLSTNAGIGNFKSFSPDGRFLLATDHGALNLHDGVTGALIRNVLNEGTATHVDWAPDDSQVALTVSEGHVDDWTIPSHTVIRVMAHLGDGEFGPLETLIDVPAPSRAYYPAWSPDSRWLAYNVSTGDCYDDPDAELWVVGRDGTAPVRLDAANLAGPLTNSWPRWGPLPDDEVLWLAFATRRPYGVSAGGIPQIWVAGFDPARASQGVDPSWPAFWLPGQDPATANHVPMWTP